jgi:hypothetical protein
MTTQTTNTIPFSLVEKYASYNSDFVEFLCMEFGGDIAKRVVMTMHWAAIDHKPYFGISPPMAMVLGGKVIAFDTNGRVKNPWLESMIPTLSSDDAEFGRLVLQGDWI